MRKAAVLISTLAIVGASLVAASPASAAGTYDPNVTRVANPANVCKSIPGTIGYVADMLEVDIDTSDFDYAGCVSSAGASAFTVPGFGNPYEQCDFLVGIGVISYPAVLHGEEGDPLPDLLVKNRRECGNALYAFHSIESAVAPYLPEAEE